MKSNDSQFRRQFIVRLARYAAALASLSLVASSEGILGQTAWPKTPAKPCSIEEIVKMIVIEQLQVDEQDVTLQANLCEDLGADSLDFVELVMQLEEEFDLKIPDKDAESMHTVGSFVTYLEEHVSRKRKATLCLPPTRKSK